MSFRVEHRTGIHAASEAIWEVIADLPGWSAWNPAFPEAGGRLALGAPLQLLERIEGLDDRRVQARIHDWVPYAQLIWTERRGWHFNSVRYIEIEELAPGSCIVANGEIFSGFRGEGYFNKHRKRLRRSCEALGDALRERVLGANFASEP